MKVLVKNNVRDPESYQVYLRGVHEVDEVTEASLLSMGSENVVSAEEMFGASSDKEQMTEAARAVGVEVAETDTKEDVAAKVDAISSYPTWATLETDDEQPEA